SRVARMHRNEGLWKSTALSEQGVQVAIVEQASRQAELVQPKPFAKRGNGFEKKFAHRVLEALGNAGPIGQLRVRLGFLEPCGYWCLEVCGVPLSIARLAEDVAAALDGGGITGARESLEFVLLPRSESTCGRQPFVNCGEPRRGGVVLQAF